MKSIDSTSVSGGGERLRTGFKLVPSSGFWTAIGSWVRSRNEMAKLQRLDDRMLKDIGLRRADLDWAAMQSEHEDPTKALQMRRNESIHAARQAARGR